MARILIVDDEPKIVTLLKSALTTRGHEVAGFHTGQGALDHLRSNPVDVVLTDLKMEPVDGLEILRQARSLDPDLQVVLLTAHGGVASAVEAMQDGAFDYLTKPFNFQEVAQVVEKAADSRRLRRENRSLKRTLSTFAAGPDLIGTSPALERLRGLIARVAPADATVLIRGESGSGKEVVARAIHRASCRYQGPFIAVNCAAIPESLQESELFGHRKGAFTGADSDRPGVFEAAHGGTLFLDEIGEAGLPVQAKLLRVLESRAVSRVGDPRELEVDVRILAATNRPLEEAIAARTFREDLYFRLQVFPLDVPPLRDRTEDIPPLVAHFLRGLGRPDAELPVLVLEGLASRPWPGNVRELRNLVERAHILAGDGPLTGDHFQTGPGAVIPGRNNRYAEPGDDLDLDRNARSLIRTAMGRAGGNKSQAAALLGITRRTLYSRLKVLGMEGEFD